MLSYITIVVVPLSTVRDARLHDMWVPVVPEEGMDTKGELHIRVMYMSALV